MTRRRTKRRVRRRRPAGGAERALARMLAPRPERLRYVSDRAPGLRRRRAGNGFVYVGPDGRRIRDRRVLARIRSLVIPPAWRDVWISPDPRGHLQAVGRDAKGRKQYRYHPRWRERRERDKFHRMIELAAALPRIRRRVARDLARPGLSREKVLATVVNLLEATHIRVGNEEYARDNGSFGLTTLRARHVRVSGERLRFRFPGKSGKVRDVELSDRRLSRIVRRCQELPGQELFRYVDEQGEARPIGSADVNRYLREITGEDLTAKDFRTWAGTVLMTCSLLGVGACRSKAEARRNVVRAIDEVAARLGNTRAVCRKSYVHPRIIETYLDGGAMPARPRPAKRPSRRGNRLREAERAVVEILRAAPASLRLAS